MGIDWKIELDLSGLDERARAAVPEALRSGASHVAEVSAPQVPLETGALLASQEVGVAGEEAWVAYRSSYAIYVHEILRNKHPHGNAKFLEIPIVTEADAVMQIVAEQIRKVQ